MQIQLSPIHIKLIYMLLKNMPKFQFRSFKKIKLTLKGLKLTYEK